MPGFAHSITRREFLADTGRLSLCGLALESLIQKGITAVDSLGNPLGPNPGPLPAKARAVIYLSMSGGPPQLDLFDWKPALQTQHLKDCPEHILKGARFAFIRGTPKLLGTPHAFRQHGASGAWVSDLLPHFAKIVDEVAILKSLHTDQLNHAPAELLLYTGNARNGAASIGAWANYGVGTQNEDLPGFIVLLSGGAAPAGGSACWGAGFLPGNYQGVQCRESGTPIPFAQNPPGMSRESRKRILDTLKKLNESEARVAGAPETLARIAQYEKAYRLQFTAPEVFDLNRESAETRALYGAQPGVPSFANNCLLARRLVEKGVRFVHLFDGGWDLHGTSQNDDLQTALPRKCQQIDQACAALVQDLKQRGLLESTLVLWGGEFGRTPMREARDDSPWLGRDHHPHAFTMRMAGAGIRRGISYGATDDLGFYGAENPVGVSDLQATVLHLLGLDAHRLSYRSQGFEERLIGHTNEAKVIHGILS
jgi:hypothetical protein